jgi:excisionase family DNA binding protein
MLLNTKQVCEILKISRSTVYKMTVNKEIPLPQKIGIKNIWRESDIQTFLANKFEGDVK